MPPSVPHPDLLTLFASQPVVEITDIQEALGGVSSMTAFRHLRRVAYRRSYNHNGRYYALIAPSQYDRQGLFSRGDIHFSRDGTLGATVQRMVQEAEAGATHRELVDRLRSRVHNTLLGLVGKSEIARQRIGGVYVYLHTDADVGAAQLRRRRERLEATAQGDVEVSDLVVIAVLLVLIRHPGCEPADVARRLQGRSPPIVLQQVRAVFAKYQLGEKGGPSIW